MVSIKYTFRPGAFATNGPMGYANVIVVHDIECPLESGYAQSLTSANYLGADAAHMGNIKSVHYVVGPDGICASCPEDIMAWHARGASYGAYGIEQTGYASFSRAQWLSPNGTKQLNYLASLIADLCTRHGIPVQFLSGQALHNAYADHSNRAAGGITTHRQLSFDGVGGNDHTDPGPNYPMDVLLATVSSLMRGGKPAPAPIPSPVIIPEDDEMMVLFKDVNNKNGAVYACGPFGARWIHDREELDSGDGVLWDKSKIHERNARQIDCIQNWANRRNGRLETYPKA